MECRRCGQATAHAVTGKVAEAKLTYLQLRCLTCGEIRLHLKGVPDAAETRSDRNQPWGALPLLDGGLPRVP